MTARVAARVMLDTAHLEESGLLAYEQGYTAGWDDAAAARRMTSPASRPNSPAICKALALPFMRRACMFCGRSTRLIHEMVGPVAEIARETLAPGGAGCLDADGRKDGRCAGNLVLNPASRAAVEALLEQATGLPLTIIEEPSLGEGQVYLRLGDIETRVDLDRATAEISAAVRGFFEIPEKEKAYG